MPIFSKSVQKHLQLVQINFQSMKLDYGRIWYFRSPSLAFGVAVAVSELRTIVLS